ncbi:hypothetical protein N780_12025 [Pontibacillus chungwhensis BH030062]|uniref:Uncharacterized protein n=1 Tax=Pontibacillus chungwhensis BH030062 TaxID=1385513 RepID=A0A0A2UZD7_9BACI|nr:hypothetical protein [Pontibacillus chungwhensis]KGP93289.1 hypothetical protein N780_12025 [Pontibacillus chungwhensis BH030062]
MSSHDTSIIYRPLVYDGQLKTYIGSPNAYHTSVEAIIEAMNFAELYNEDMYDGAILWEDSEVTRGANNNLRILSGTLNSDTPPTFFIEIKQLLDNGTIKVSEKSRAKPVARERNEALAMRVGEEIDLMDYPVNE